MIRLTLNIDAVDDLRETTAYGTAARAIVESSTSETGTYTAVGTAVLVAGQTQYELWDNGTSSTWYRYRIANGASTAYSAYTDPFRATALAAYATVDDLLLRLNLPDETRYSLLADVLVSVSAQMDTECGRKFLRAPQVSGTEARIYDGDGSPVLAEPDGIVSVTSVEVRDDVTSAWYTLDTDSYTLKPNRPEPYRPYSHLVLYSTAVDYTTFPVGMDTIRVTGVFGYAEVPPLVREAVIELACRVYSESQTAYAGVVGMPDVTGQTVMPPNRPDAWHRAVRLFGRRSGLAV